MVVLTIKCLGTMHVKDGPWPTSGCDILAKLLKSPECHFQSKMKNVKASVLQDYCDHSPQIHSVADCISNGDHTDTHIPIPNALRL